MTEETQNAAMAGSIGIITAIGVSAVLGWFLILGLLFSIQDLQTTLNSPTGQPVAQIFLDTVGEKGAIVLMIIVIGAMYFCGWVEPLVRYAGLELIATLTHRTFSVTSNSRMMYAFARDGGIPGHEFFRKVDSKRGTPVRTGPYRGYIWDRFLDRHTVWLACFLSFLLALPSLGSSVAFAAATSIATIGLYISYGKGPGLTNSVCTLSIHTNVSNSNHVTRSLSEAVHPWALPPRFILYPNCCRRCYLGGIYCDRIHASADQCMCRSSSSMSPGSLSTIIIARQLANS